jgi:hemerythrin-like domain-containing protein
MYMAHAMFRREIGLMPALVRAVPAGEVERAAIVADHVELIDAVLQHHHHGEDEHLWPKLQARGGAEAAEVARLMQGQHDQIDVVTAAVKLGLARWRAAADPKQAAELADSLSQLHGLVVEHLAVEEDQALPLIERYVTAAEWEAMVAEGAAGAAPEQLPLMFGLMLYEADPELLDIVLAQMPPEMRSALTEQAAQAFGDHAQRVHGTRTPPRIGAVR